MNYREKKEIEYSHPWANKLFVDSFLQKREAEKKIIDSLYKIYEFYPEYYIVSELYESTLEEKIKIKVLKFKETIKATLASGAGACMADLLGKDINLYSFLGALAVIAGGSEALYQLNKQDLNLKFSFKEKREILKDFKKKCEDFEALLNDYGFLVQDYILNYEKNNVVNWLANLNNIVVSNEKYIRSKKEQGLFAERFNSLTALGLHSEIFDIDEFNEILTTIKNEYEELKSEQKSQKL